MAYEDVLGRALDAADNAGKIDYDDNKSVRDFINVFDEFLIDENGEPLDHFPSADEIRETQGKEAVGDWIEFLNEYGLWDEFREDWEQYGKT